jgi:threonylcarbamoyladenosine tRNA methylthiotransferase MtaB
MARGKSRSDTIDHVVQQAQNLAQNEVKEIVLTGVNLGDFGKGPDGDKKHQETFYELIQALDQVEGIERFRISSIEPNLLSSEIIHFVAESRRFMPHFHIPLQSGSNKILALMKRRYRRELYAERVHLIKTLLPHCSIGVDVITGFPSETAADFQETLDFLHDLDISYLHVFTYSEREDTEALNIHPIVPISERQQRTRKLRNLSFLKQQHFEEQHRGQTRKVLFERSEQNGQMEGYTDNYIKVTVPYQQELANQIVPWRL